MPKAWVVPSQLLPPAFSKLDIFKQLWPSESTPGNYVKLPQLNETGDEFQVACEEDGLNQQDQRRRKDSTALKFIFQFGIPIACVFMAMTLIGRLALIGRQPTTLGRTVPPLTISFMPYSDEKIDCDPPVKIVPPEENPRVLIWHNPSVSISTFDGEKARREKPWQLNAYWSLENEEYYPSLHEARLKLQAGDPTAFDLAITYRLDSDFPIPYAYQFLDFRKKSLPFEQRRQDKLVAAFISNCSPNNNRTEVLNELIKLLPGQVDSFGYCQRNADPLEVIDKFNWNPLNATEPTKSLSTWRRKMLIISRYKFTVAFENANEPGYVTEKYYQALSAGSIPIHLGQTREYFENFKPWPKCALNVADFKTIEELANRIKEIGNDRRAFESFLEWKNKPYSSSFERLVSWGRTHEACRLAKWAQNEWQNPLVNYTGRYDALRARLKLPQSSGNITNTNSSSS